ncbi:PRC-barrel domain-containing protein [Paenarthrobacter sp. S56]|uniref:PRC-barrel domain-containing protein n=1 Tax=Paenarthrobacter sp. S56 TaxID=3138179 RepID=UPI00321A2111
MLSLQDIDQIVLNGGIVVDSAGDKIGSVEQVFLNGDSGDPAFVTVRTGFFGLSESFAPLEGATVVDTVITLAVTKEQVAKAPPDGQQPRFPHREPGKRAVQVLRPAARG